MKGCQNNSVANSKVSPSAAFMNPGVVGFSIELRNIETFEARETTLPNHH